MIVAVLPPDSSGSQPEMCCNHCLGGCRALGRRVWYAPGRLVAAGFDACLSADLGLLPCVAALCLRGARHPQTCSLWSYIPPVNSLARDLLVGRLAGLDACSRLLGATAFVGSRLWAAGQGHSTCAEGSCQAACSLMSTPPRNCPETAGSQFWMLRTCLLKDLSTRLWAASPAVLATYSCTFASQTLQAAH